MLWHAKAIAGIWFSLRVALVFVFSVCPFIPPSITYLLRSCDEPGTVLGLEI